MLLNKRPALFGVAGVAGVVDGIFGDQLGSGGTVNIVAIRTGHLALGNRMVGWLAKLGTLLLVAGVADLCLGRLLQHFVCFRVHLMATIAGDVGRLVLTALPKGLLVIIVVTTLANQASFFGGHRRDTAKFFTESSVRFGQLFDISRFVGVCLAGAMARKTGGRF